MNIQYELVKEFGEHLPSNAESLEFLLFMSLLMGFMLIVLASNKYSFILKKLNRLF